jgi:hypothetical protein
VDVEHEGFLQWGKEKEPGVTLWYRTVGGGFAAVAAAQVGVDGNLEAGGDGEAGGEGGDLDEDIDGCGGVVAGGEEVEHGKSVEGRAQRRNVQGGEFVQTYS